MALLLKSYSQESGRPNILVWCRAVVGAQDGTAVKAASRKAARQPRRTPASPTAVAVVSARPR